MRSLGRVVAQMWGPPVRAWAIGQAPSGSGVFCVLGPVLQVIAANEG